jgi:DNA-directed RNA polymerase specialized sigma24 family protein
VSSADRELVERAVRREPRACAALVERFTPIIRRRVARALQVHGARSGRAVERGDVLDLAQEVFVVLLDREARVLRSWEPSRGLSLDNFVGLVAEREARSIARSGRRSAWAERPTAYDDLSVHPASHSMEGELSSRDELTRALGALRERLTPAGYAMFEALFLDESSIEEVAARFATTANALYTFRSRLRRELASLRGDPGQLATAAGETP